jgi:hypothetical protein
VTTRQEIPYIKPSLIVVRYESTSHPGTNLIQTARRPNSGRHIF